MGLNRIENAQIATNLIEDFSVSPESLDSPTEQEENYYTPDFDKWFGYYKTIPEAKAIVDTLIKYTWGKGFKADDKNIEKLNKIVGNGKETALKVFKNLDRVSYICGDAFGHIIKDKQGRMVNLKPLNSETMRIVTNSAGIIIRFEQLTTDKKEIATTFSVDEILHLQKNRIGDSIGGLGIFEALENVILARNELMGDLKVLFHRFVVPLKVWEAETDDISKLQTTGVQITTAMKNFENMVVPKGTIELKEIMAVPNQTGGLSPLDYYSELIRIFVSACGVPEVIMGWGKDTTEASAKVVYLSWQQTIEDAQLEREEEIKQQLNIEINLEFPADIAQNLKDDNSKDGKSISKKSDLEAKI